MSFTKPWNRISSVQTFPKSRAQFTRLNSLSCNNKSDTKWNIDSPGNANHHTNLGVIRGGARVSQ